MRAAFVEASLNFAYFVVGDTIYRMDTAETVIQLSPPAFLTATGHIGIAENNARQIAFVDGQKLLLWDGATLTDETANLPTNVSPLDIDYFDGSFIIVNGNTTTGTNRFYISALNNGKSWFAPTGKFAAAQRNPTILTAIKKLQSRFYLFGTISGELWLDAAASVTDFSYRRDNNVYMEHGVASRSSVAESPDEEKGARLFYLSQNKNGVGGVMMTIGGYPKKVSTREVDEVIQSFTNPSDATGFVIKINGQLFYQINFTLDQRTFVYNVDTNKWHELESRDEGRHIANAHIFFNKKHYVGAYNDSNLYILSNEYNNITFLDTDPLTGKLREEVIKRTRIMHMLSSPTYERIRISRIQVDMLQGVGLPKTTVDDPDHSPVMFLSISTDGGQSYQGFERRPIGESGRTRTRTIWRNLGAHRDTIIKVEVFNAVQFYILGAAAYITVDDQ
jgi:hypothetical protein